MDSNLIYKLIIWVIPIVLAITFHEAGHAWMAYKLGDDTAKKLGRVSANPIPHIDLIGTIVLPLIMYFSSPVIFGWAKPVPVIAHKLHKPRRDMALVALAGPGANFVMVFGWLLLFKFSYVQGSDGITDGFAQMALAGIFINLLLAFFNLLPFPPLDGGRVLTSLLPAKLAVPFAKIERFGILIVLALYFLPGLLGLNIGLEHFLMQLILGAEMLCLHLFGFENPAAIIHSFFS